MTLRHYKIFLTVCETGSVTKASKLLYMAQPAVSLAISELEKHYGVKLFDRLSRRLYLTEHGRKMQLSATTILSLVDEMEENLMNPEAPQSIKIGSSITIGIQLLPSILSSFSKKYPQFSHQVTIKNSSSICNDVLNNNLDIGLVEGTNSSPLLHFEPFRDDRLVFVCNLNHPFANKNTITEHDLLNEKFLLREKGSAARDILENILKSRDISIDITWESASSLAIIEAIKENLGISFLPYLIVEKSLNNDEIATFDVSTINLNRQFYLVTHEKKYQTKVVDALVDEIKKNYGTL